MSSVSKSEALRTLFMEAVVLGRARRGHARYIVSKRIEQVLVQMRIVRELPGEPFFCDHYETTLLLEAGRQRNLDGECCVSDREILGQILEDYAHFYTCFLGFWKLPKLRLEFQRQQLFEWCQVESHPEAFHVFIDQYFGLVDDALRIGDDVSEEELRRLMLIATVFHVPFTARMSEVIADHFGSTALLH